MKQVFVSILFFLVFAVDIFLSFHTAYFHDAEGLVRKKKKIASKYLGSWFVPDLYWCLPVMQITKVICDFGLIVSVSCLVFVSFLSGSWSGRGCLCLPIRLPAWSGLCGLV